ncbi:hypothetical protein CR513_45103, partial [Mucuna pruriens]
MVLRAEDKSFDGPLYIMCIMRHEVTHHIICYGSSSTVEYVWLDLDKSSVKGVRERSMLSSSASFLRQLSAKEPWKSTSNRWSGKQRFISGCEGETSVNQMEGFNMHGNGDSGVMGRKRVMVLVDDTSHSKHAMMWALTHVANKGDSLTLLHIVPPHKGSESSSSTYLVNYLGSLCRDCKPGMANEKNHDKYSDASAFLSTVLPLLFLPPLKKELLIGLWSDIGGGGSARNPRTKTGHSNEPSKEAGGLCLGTGPKEAIFSFKLGVWVFKAIHLCGNSGSSSAEDIVEHCINNAECLTIGVRKRSQGTNGYLISTRWQKNFWLLA